MVLEKLVYLSAIIQQDEVDLPTPDVGADSTKISSVLMVVFGIFGGITLIVLILAGIKFITSQGDPAGVNQAKNTIIYAAIGLAVSIAAFAIVSFAVGNL